MITLSLLNDYNMRTDILGYVEDDKDLQKIVSTLERKYETTLSETEKSTEECRMFVDEKEERMFTIEKAEKVVV